MDPWILVLVLDLVAALLDAGRDRTLEARCGGARRAPLRCRERIPQAADAGRQIAGGTAAGVEMLMELPVGWRNDDTMLPVDANELPVTLEPQQRIAGTDHAHHMIAGEVAVAFLVGTDRHLGNVRMHQAIGEREHDVGPAGA